ncbi:hypothetical protein HW278_01305 [Capnocytophaga sp. oral taxon 902]|jgi:hypothetical protein|uniref:hypothetical protein n=1 Tax=Capnocytophaga TaxID=1016 RepID=UPI0015C13DF1|nr:MULTISPECIES: hypothetical protein [Capnocytophaga]QLF49438.1 hypothetical protein HW278_01305 [Capnocytophaga sp. oral taxon 902]UZD35798.1 hypothetical protein OLG90_08900 [Capnocytophaga ochracea]
MKTKTFLALLILVIAGCGCSKTDKDTSPEAVIVREISKIRVYLGDEKFGTYKVIQNRKTLDSAFSNVEFSTLEQFKDIDFTTETLLLGYDNYANQADFHFQFVKIKANNYSLTVKISGLATKPDTFLYGIVVKKLPNNANVSFNIQKSN